MYNPYQNTGYFQQQRQQPQQQPFGQQNPQATGFGGIQGNLSSAPMGFTQLQPQQQTMRFGGGNTAVNPANMNSLLPSQSQNFGSQQSTGMMGLAGAPTTAPNQGGFVSPSAQQQPQSTGYFQSNALPLQQPQIQSQPTGFQANTLLPNPTGGIQPLLPQSTGFYRPTGGMAQAPLEPLRPTATGLVNSFANSGINHDIKIPTRRLPFITSKDQAKFETLFRSMVPKGSNTISGENCKKIFLKSGLQASELAKIWKLCDTTRAGELLFPEFCLAMHLVNDVLQGDSIPYELDSKTKNEVASFVDAINLSIARGDGDPGPKTPFDNLMMGGLKPQPTGFIPPTSFGMPLQNQATGGMGMLNPQRTGFMPQTSFGMPAQRTGGAQFNPMSNIPGSIGVQPTGFMPQTSFGAPLQSQLTGSAMQTQSTGAFPNNNFMGMQSQPTGGFPALQPQKAKPQITGSLLPQSTGSLRPQSTGGFQVQQPQPFDSFQSQSRGNFQPQGPAGLKAQGTGGFQQHGFGGNIQSQPTGGFQQSQPTGGFQQSQPTGGFQQSQPTGGFQQSQPTGGFQQSQPTGGFQQSQPTGGFQQSQPTGGFQQSQPTLGLQLQRTGGLQQPQPQPTGGLQLQHTGGFQQPQSQLTNGLQLQPQSTGGLVPQLTGSLKPQGTGSLGQQGNMMPPLRPQGTGSFGNNLAQQSTGGFQGISMPQQQSQLTSNLMPNMTGGGSTAVPIQQTGLSTQSTGFLPPSGFNPTQPLSAQKTGLGNNEIYTQSNFGQNFNGQNVDEILPEEKSLFYKIFQTYDSDNRGLLDASKAVEIFRKSGLNRGDLEHIWALCDINNTGQLNKQEFALGMHLVYRKLNGFQLPNRLPLNLIPSSTKILDDVKNQIKSSVAIDDRRSSTRTDALSYKNNDDEDVLPSFRNRRKVFGANASPPSNQNTHVSVVSTPAPIQQETVNISDLKNAIYDKKQRLDIEKLRLQSANNSDVDSRLVSSLKSQINELPFISVVNDSVPVDLKRRYDILMVKLPNLFAQIDEIDLQIRNSRLQLFKMKSPFSVSGSGPNGEITDEDRKKAKSKALLKSRMNALTGRSSVPVGSFEEEEIKYNEEVSKINASCDSNKKIIGDVKSSIAEIAASLETGMSGGSVHDNPSDFEMWEFGSNLEPEVRDFIYNMKERASQSGQNNPSSNTNSNYSEQNYPRSTSNETARESPGNQSQSHLHVHPQHLQQSTTGYSQPVGDGTTENHNYRDPSGNFPCQSTTNKPSYFPTHTNQPGNYGGDSKRSHTYGQDIAPNQTPLGGQVDDDDDGEDEEEKQLRQKLEMLKLKKKNDKQKRLADLRRQIEEAKAEGDEEAEMLALQNVANQRSSSTVSASQDLTPKVTSPPAYNQERSVHYSNVNSSRPSYMGGSAVTGSNIQAMHSSTVMSSSSVSSISSPQPSGQVSSQSASSRNAFFKQDASAGSSFDMKAAETQRRLQRGLANDDESDGWSDDEHNDTETAPVAPAPVAPAPMAPAPVAPAPVAPAPVAPSPMAPVAPSPMAPSPVAPAPVAPSPMAPAPVAPAPVAPSPMAPVAPSPMAPSPVAPAPVAPSPMAPAPVAPAIPQAKGGDQPIPVAPPLPHLQEQNPPVPIAPPLPQLQSGGQPFLPGPPPLMPTENEYSEHQETAGEYVNEDNDDNDSLSIPESVGSEENFNGVPAPPGNIPPPPPLP